MDYSPECRQIGGIKRPSLLNILSAIEVMGLMRSPSTLPTLIRERKKSGSLKMEYPLEISRFAIGNGSVEKLMTTHENSMVIFFHSELLVITRW